jgi:hypothetical protein
MRQFVRNCDFCGQNKSWTDKRQKFLKSLPIRNKIWREISIDFITDLPENEKYTNLINITNHLGKEIILKTYSNMQTKTIIEKFVRLFYRYHEILTIIISDRHRQFVGSLEIKICQFLRIERRLFIVYYLETDGSIERIN